MKILNKAPRLLISALLATSLAACSSAPAETDGLVDARREVQRVYPDAGIPNIEGVELSLAYKDKSFSLPDELKSDEADPMDKDSIVLVYSREKGKLRSEDTLPIEELLYGPYEGDQTLLLTLSERPATVQGSEARVVEGTEIQVAKLQNHTIYATARPNDVTYTLQAGTDSGFEEDELLGILSQVSTAQEN